MQNTYHKSIHIKFILNIDGPINMRSLPSAGTTDDAMIANVRDNIPEDWSQFVHKYTPLVYHWCRKSGFQTEDSSDIAQNVFYSVFQAIDNFSKDNQSHSFRSWLWKITRFRICDYLKSNMNKPIANGGSEMNQFLKEHAGPFLDPSSSTDEDSLVNILYVAMATVSSQVNEQTWQAFEMLSFEAYSPKEVAEELEMTPAAVRMLKSRVLKRLKDEIEKMQKP